MPTFHFKCESCGWNDAVVVKGYITAVKCGNCGSCANKQFSPTRNLKLAAYMRAENEEPRAKHRAWLQLPETQAKIKSGELDHPADRHAND